MSDTHKPNEKASYNSPRHGNLELTFLAVDPKNEKGKYLVASQGENEHKIRLHRLPSLNIKNVKEAEVIMEHDLDTQKALEKAEADAKMKQIIEDEDIEMKIGKYDIAKLFGGRRKTRRRKRKRRRKSTKKKRKRRRTKKKRRRTKKKRRRRH